MSDAPIVDIAADSPWARHAARGHVMIKTFSNYPCAHRQWRHDGHCAHVHGYSRSFMFMFACHTLEPCGFVLDFGKLKAIKSLLDDLFDHTLLLHTDDPLLRWFEAIEQKGGARIKLLPYGPSMEGTARFLCEHVNAMVGEDTNGRAWVVAVEARENDKNAALYSNPEVPQPQLQL